MEKARIPVSIKSTMIQIPTLEKKIHHCSKHGRDYESSLHIHGSKKHWSRCPECIREDDEKRRGESLKELKHNQFEDGLKLIPKRYQSKTLEDFICHSLEQSYIHSRCKAYVEKFSKVLAGGTSLIFSGGVGTGKTLLASGIATELYKAGYSVVYNSGYGIVAEFKSTFRKDSEKTEEDVLKKYTEPELLIIDEVDIQTSTDFSKDILYQVIHTRYENITPTLLISNLNQGDLA